MGDTTTNPVLKLMYDRWTEVSEAESETRQVGLECDRFYVGDQWPNNVAQARLLARQPCLTINQLPKFVRQVTNDMRMNRPSAKIAPVEDTDEDVANIYEGLIRHIQYESNAQAAYDTAGASAVRKGWGYFRLITEYENEDSFDQVIRVRRIKNAFSVYMDPNVQQPDASDARYAFIVADVLKEDFKKQNPKALINDVTLSSTGDAMKDWADGRYVRVAEYFEVAEKDDTLCLMMDGKTMLKSEMSKEAYDQATAQGFIKRERPTQRRTVIWRKVTAWEVLEEREWPGKWIPVIPVYGEDLEVDGRRYLRGMIQDAMDPQRQYNYMSTAQTEAIALSPKAPFIAAVGQIANLEQFWKNANLQQFPYLPYNPITVDGVVLPPPARNQAEAPVQAMVQATAKAYEDLKATTGIFDAGLGNRSNETSGKAILARQKEGDVTNFHYVDNLSIAIRFLGIQCIDLIPKIYDAPRVVRIVGEDETSKTVKVNQPSGEKDMNGVEKIYDLTSGKYDVTVVVGPSFSTKRQESADAMVQMVQADPTLMQKAGDLIVKNMDFPMAQELAERLKKTLPPQLQEENDQEIPPQAQAQMAQMSMMVEQLTQVVNQLQTEKDAKTAEIDSRERIALRNNETQLIVETLKQESSASMELLRAELTQITAALAAMNQPAEEKAKPAA